MLEASKLDLNQFGYGGDWEIDDETATAGDAATIGLEFKARRVFLVLGSPDGPRQVAGRCSTASRSPTRTPATTSPTATATIAEQRLYRLVDLPQAGEHTLELRFDDGIEGYAFTFG